MSTRRSAGRPPSRVRRRTLALLGCGLGAPLAGACAPPAPVDRQVRLPLVDVAPGERVRVEYRDAPVEVRRTDTAIEARSLLCTHFGCRVRWSEERSLYLCPCHDGAFDGDGRPVAGPPVEPLRPVLVARVGDEILVGEP